MKGRIYALMLIAMMLIAPIVAAVATAQQEPVTITIGALLPLTGDLQSYGERAKAAVEFAVDQMNNYLEQENAWFRLQLVVEDTQTQPDIAVQKFNNLVAQGIKFIVGPMTSAEVKSLKDLANQQNVLIISPSSTAIELAIPDDNVFRFCPADDVQSKAIGTLVDELGIKSVVIIYRDDTWGDGLRQATEQVLADKGIEVANVYSYNPESPGFATIVSNVNNDVKNLLNEYKTNEVAVIVIGFNEVKDLFLEARKYPDLSKVLWVGSDGTALLTEIVDDPNSGKFAKEVMFINPIFSPAATDVQQQVAAYVEQELGTQPDAYSLAAHDAVVAITLALLQAGPMEDPDQMVNTVKQLLPDITTSDEFAQFAATGKFPLNDAGDRATADYDWWVVVEKQENEYDWAKAGTYKGLDDANEWIQVAELGGKTFPEAFNEKFAPAPAEETAPAETGQGAGAEQTTTVQEEGGNTGLIAAAIIVIIIIAAAAFFLKKS